MTAPVAHQLPHRTLRDLRRWQDKARSLEADEVKTTATQLLRYGVCPCVAMGVYASCCGPFHGPLGVR